MTEPERPPQDAAPSTRPPASAEKGAAQPALDAGARRELLKGLEPPPRPTLVDMARASPITFGLIAINVAVFMWAETHGRTTDVGVLLTVGASEQLHVWSGEYWRLLTPMFLHVGLAHLLWNAYASVGWCTGVERVLGKARFLAVYLPSGIGGATLSVIAQPVPSAGASGAAFGIVGATLVLRRRMLPSWRAMAADPPTRSTLAGILLWAFIGIAVNADNFAHLGGLLTGAALTWLFTMRPASRLAWGGFAVAFGALLAIAMRPGWHPTRAQAERLTEFAQLFATGKAGFSRNDVRAAKFFRLACDGQWVDACGYYGAMLAEGRGTVADPAHGKALIEAACAKGSASACKMNAAGRAPK